MSIFGMERPSGGGNVTENYEDYLRATDSFYEKLFKREIREDDYSATNVADFANLVDITLNGGTYNG